MKTVYIVIMFLFPLLYFINGLTPWSQGLWGARNHDYYFPYWISVLVLHWASVALAFFFLKKSGMKLADIGFTLKNKGRIIFLASFLLISLGMLFFTEWSLNYVTVDEAAVAGMNNFFPRTTGERIFWIFCAFSAGFCEEFVYRGFCIKMLEKRGVNKWLGILIAALPFVLMHSFGALTSVTAFGNYLIMGIVFGLIFVISKRLWVPMMAHMLFDVFAMMAIFQFTV